MSNAYPMLEKERFMSLTTYRKTGKAVLTPVWFAQEGDRLVIMTGADSGKVKRLRHTDTVELAPCKANGEITGESMTAKGRILPESDWKDANKLLNSKYSWQKMIFDLLGRVQGAKRVYLEIVPE